MSQPAMAFSPILYFDPQMVAEIALGAEHPHDIAERYGFDAVAYETLAALHWFGELVARKRQELADDGVLFTAKAGMMAEALLTRLFQQSMAGSLAAPLMVETAKQLSDIGRLKPASAAAAASAGPPFQINIQVNGTDVVRSHAPQELVPEVVAETVMTLDFAPQLPPPPAALKVPDFDLRPSALVGTPAAVMAATASPPAGPSRSLDTQPGASVGTPIGLPTTRPQV
jgi:hypothetical protein